MKYLARRAKGMLSIAVAILVIGSIWGLLEMTLGGFLHTIHFAHKGAVMGGLAISLMAVFVTITKKPLLVPILGVIAAAFKPFSAFIFGVPVMSPFVINPAIAIVMEAMAFGAIVLILKSAIDKRLFARAGAGFAAGILGITFYAIIASLFGLGQWAFLDLESKIQSVMATGIPVALAGAVMMVAGQFTGKLSLPHLVSVEKLHPRFYYPVSLALVAFSWAIPPMFRLGG
jgi:hypothetical protein